MLISGAVVFRVKHLQRGLKMRFPPITVARRGQWFSVIGATRAAGPQTSQKSGPLQPRHSAYLSTRPVRSIRRCDRTGCAGYPSTGPCSGPQIHSERVPRRTVHFYFRSAPTCKGSFATCRKSLRASKARDVVQGKPERDSGPRVRSFGAAGEMVLAVQPHGRAAQSSSASSMNPWLSTTLPFCNDRRANL
jgi:hypothetical protein